MSSKKITSTIDNLIKQFHLCLFQYILQTKKSFLRRKQFLQQVFFKKLNATTEITNGQTTTKALKQFHDLSQVNETCHFSYNLLNSLRKVTEFVVGS